MSRAQCSQLLGIIEGCIAAKRATNHALSPRQRLLVALRFFASGDYFYCVGDAERENFFHTYNPPLLVNKFSYYY